MPMYTPTTQHVAARDNRVPPMFRPTNQANLEPASSINFSATQNMLPGMGSVRRGNEMTSGINPDEEAEFTRQVRNAEVTRKRAKKATRTEAGRLKRRIQEVKARLDRAVATGQEPPANAMAELNQLQAKLQWLGRMKQAEKEHGSAEQMPFKRRVHLPRVHAPTTPDPEAYASTGISHQKNRGQILDMQKNIQPVESYAAAARSRRRFYRRRGGGFNGVGSIEYRPLVVGGLIIAGLFAINRIKG